MNTDFTRENAIENIAILKIPTKSYRKRLERPETYKFVKRFLDIVLASIGMIVLSPIFLIISLAIKLESKEYRENYKLTNDPRITKVGKFLRKTSLDELPQLINIIKGDLSIIGPRPVVSDELKKYGTNTRKFLSVTPGLTGYWAANGRSCTSYEQRMQMELFYIDNLSLKMDIKVFFKTIEAVIKREGAI